MIVFWQKITFDVVINKRVQFHRRAATLPQYLRRTACTCLSVLCCGRQRLIG